jgi:hypothetical protein
MSGPRPYITVNLTRLYNACDTILTLQAYGDAAGAGYNSKITLNGGGNGDNNGTISFIINNTKIFEINTGGVTLSTGNLNGNCTGSSGSCTGTANYANNLTNGYKLLNGYLQISTAANEWNLYHANVWRYTGPGGGTNMEVSYTANTSLYVNAAIYCGTNFLAASDRRIKKEITDINDDNALQKILLIQPKTYKYIDLISRGDDIVYGFISQEIKEIIPQAVRFTKDYIPNIYRLANSSNNIIILDSDISNELNIDDKIKIIDGNEEEIKCNIKNINSNIIEIDKSINTSNCFVYGKEINDFLALNKDYIFTLNVCATQELHRLIQQQNIIIQEQNYKILHFG